MKLLHFRVRKFRSIVDSGVILLQDDVTCFVGKNEAGKSALLEALYLFNPAYGEKWNIAEQYPVWLKVQDRRSGDIEKTGVIEVGFEIESDDVAAVEAVLGPGVIKPHNVAITEQYDGHRTWSDVKYDTKKAIANLVKQFPKSIQGNFKDAGDLPDIRARLEAATADEKLSDEDIASAKSILSDLGLSKETIWDNLYPILRKKVPQFFRFTNYSTLPGRIDFQELQNIPASAPNAEGLKTAKALLTLAGTDIDQLTDEDYELRKGELEAVQIDLTNQVFEYWKQNPNLEVNMDVDKTTRQLDGGKSSAVARFLDIRLRDKRTGYSNNFSQRSSGFQWFFSFLAAFSEFDSGNSPIVLLDEPALTLHGKAQADFLRFIHERLAPSTPVLYTTHSPFMVQANRLEQIRIVEDHGPPKGSVVTDKSAVADRDSLFPLQAALGYDIAQNLFIGPNNLVVEGTSEVIYLQVISRLCAEKKYDSLDTRWRVLPAGGATNIPTFVSLLGPHLDVTVFADTNASGMKRIKNMIDAGLIEGDRLFLADSACSVKNADTEDIFSPGEYLKYYNATFGTKHKLADLPQDSRIVKRLEKQDGTYDHGRVAESFLRDHHKISVSDSTLKRFSVLFAAINETITE